MFVVQDFIRWALLHVHKDTIPQGAKLAVPAALCGIEPWEYLFGSIRVPTTPQVLDAYYKNRYSQIMTRTEFDAITSAWPTNTYATDCQGLLDAWLTYEMDYPTDINAQANYALWCTQKGRIDEISRPYVMGEAVFRSDPAGRMTHVGWICGEIGGEPLIVEARGIRFGVVVSKLSERNFDFRGLMKNMFSYKEDAKMPVKLQLTKPMMSGNAILAIQYALNELGYTDENGNRLTEDGKCGAKTMFAVDAFANNQQTVCSMLNGPTFVIPSENGAARLTITVEE